MTLPSSSLLQRMLIADAVISGITGVALLLGAGPLSAWLNVPVALLRVSGAILLPFAAMVLLFSSAISPARVWTVIGLNFAWVAASALVLVGGWIQPNTLGMAFVIGQAVAVAVLAELQFTGLRRSLA
jgi:hypothetical protein